MQGRPLTWAIQTVSILDTEQGAVEGTLNHIILIVEKLIGHPVQWSTGMGTAVHIGITGPILHHQKSCPRRVDVLARQGKFATLALYG
jgi:hypothetical protein